MKGRSSSEDDAQSLPAVHFASAEGRWILTATVLGSAMTQLDATVVNVALPMMGRDLGAGVAELQLVVTGYSVTLAAERARWRSASVHGCRSPWDRS